MDNSTEFNACLDTNLCVKMLANGSLHFTVYLANSLIFQQDLISTVSNTVT